MVASFTLARYPRRQVPRALAGMALDRLPLALQPGLRFWRLLGVGRGASFSRSADLHRWGMFAVWGSQEAVERFRDGSLHAGWAARADEVWTVALAPYRWHGRWGGRDPLAGIVPAPAPAGPVAVLTRATVRPGKLAAFWSAVPGSAAGLPGDAGLLRSVGVGESPVLHQATFSLWRDADAMRDYAYRHPEHLEAVRRSRDERWYAEELFARFSPVGSWGSWGGVDPLASPG